MRGRGLNVGVAIRGERSLVGGSCEGAWPNYGRGYQRGALVGGAGPVMGRGLNVGVAIRDERSLVGGSCEGAWPKYGRGYQRGALTGAP